MYQMYGGYFIFQKQDVYQDLVNHKTKSPTIDRLSNDKPKTKIGIYKELT